MWNFELLGIWWIWWALGTFGLIGTGLLIWLAPTVLGQIAVSLFRFFVTTRLGNIILVGAICFFIGDVNRSLHDAQELKILMASADEAAKQRDQQIAEETRQQVLDEIKTQRLKDAAVDQQVKEFHDALPPIPDTQGNPFWVGPDACRLRLLAGQTRCGPDGSVPGVPEVRTAGQTGAHPKGHRLPRFIRRSLGLDREGK